MRKMWIAGSLAVAMCLAACGSGTQKRLLTRPDTYDKLMGFPSTGNPLDIEALVAQYPELRGIVMTAPEYIEEFDRLRKKAEAEGRAVIPYRIPHGANLKIEVLNEPTLSRSYYVGPHGFVYFPYVNKLRVRGLTVEELKASLEEKLSAYLKKPEVYVHILRSPPGFRSEDGSQTGGSSESSQIHLFGAVSGANRFRTGLQYTGGQTLISILGAYGLPASADWRQVRIIRRSEEDPLRKSRVIICDLWAYFAHADVRQDIPLLPGDVVYVPIKWTLGDQFTKDWNMTLKYMRDALFLDQFRDAARDDGAFRNP